MSLSRFAGRFNANSFAYGIFPEPNGLRISTGSVPAGSGTINLDFGFVTTSDGITFNPLNTNAPILIGSGANAETVTPSAVSQPTPAVYNTTTLTATFSNAHGTGDVISSGTFGLQEAINAASAAGGGVVVVDGQWTLRGGTQAILNAAVLPAGVQIEDLRSGEADIVRYVTVAIPNAQVKTLFSVGTAIIPAQGAGTLIEVISMVLENKFLTAAFAAGGAIQLSYGSGVTIPASATIAATFLTSPVANQVILVAGALASNLASAVLNTAVNIAAATADFTTGAGSLVAKVAYRVHTGL